MAEIVITERPSIRISNRTGPERIVTAEPLFGPPSADMVSGLLAAHREVVAEAEARRAADIALGFLIAGATGPIDGQAFDATVAVELASIDPAQTVIYTAGYAEAGDGGAARFVRSVEETWLQSLDGAYWALDVNEVYAEMCGAVGTGPHDAAIALAYTQSKRVRLGPRGFAVTEPIVVPADGALIGAGRGVTYITATGCTAIAPEDGVRAPVIEDMTLVGDSTPGTWGIMFSNNDGGARATRVDVYAFGSAVPAESETAADRGGGIGLFGSWEATNMFGALLDQVRVDYCGVGIFADHVNTLTLHACLSRLNYGNALEVQYCIGLSVAGGQYENVLAVAPDETPTVYPGTAVLLTAVKAANIAALYAENQSVNLVRLDTCEAVSIAGAYVDNAGTETSGTMIALVASCECSIGPIKVGGLFHAAKRAITFDIDSYNNTVAGLSIDGAAADFATAIEDAGVGNQVGPSRVNGTLQQPYSPPRLPTYSTAAANALPAGRKGAGTLALISNGDGGDPCLAVSDGTTWYRVTFGAAISAT